MPPTRWLQRRVWKAGAPGGFRSRFGWQGRATGPAGFEKLVVIKRVLSQFLSDPRFTSLFLQEARLSAQLRHPNIVQIFDLGKTEDGYFLCMEFVDGPNLREFIEVRRRRQIQVPLGAAVWIAAKVFSALDYGHERAESGGLRLKSFIGT